MRWSNLPNLSRTALLIVVGGLLVAAAPARAATIGPLPPAKLTVVEPDAGDDYDLVGTLVPLAASSDSSTVVAFNVSESGEGYQVRFTADEVTIYKVRGRSGQRIGLTGKVSLLPANGAVPVSIKRRADRITVVVGTQVVTRAFDQTFSEGAAGWQVSGNGFEWKDLRYQPISAIYFSDDFMREQQDGLRDWEAAVGKWELTHMPVPERSANAFWFLGRAEPEALAVAGYPFWDSYDFEASVRSPQAGALGLVFYYVGPQRYLLFRWTSAASTAPDGDRRQLIEVTPSGRRVLAEAKGGYVPNEYQWYRLQVAVDDRHVEVFIDGQPALSAPHADLAQGRIGLYCERNSGVYFDDVSVRSRSRVRSDFVDGAGCSEWDPAEGRWSVAEGALTAKGAATSLCGLPTWVDYDFQASVQGRDESGLLVYYQDPRNHYEVRLLPAAQRAELVRVLDGRREVVAQAPAALSKTAPNALTLEANHHYLRVLLGDRLLFSQYDAAFETGKVGLLVPSGARASFSKLGVTFRDRRVTDAAIATRFTVDRYMQEWAGEWGDWVQPDPKRPVLCWHKGDFFGDFLSLFRVKGLAAATSGQLSCFLGHEDLSATTGYRLTISPTPAHTLKLELYRAGVSVAQQDAPIGEMGDPGEIRIERDGPFIITRIDDEVRLVYRDPTPLDTCKVGFEPQNFVTERPVVHASVVGQQERNYTFAAAPTEWLVQNGTWGIMARYSCDPKWSWFGGFSDEPTAGIAAVWNKYEFPGDFTFEYYCGIKMSVPAEWGVYDDRFRDIGATICADGKTLASGYTLILAGWNNTTTRLLRGNTIVAETKDPKFLLPKKDQGHRLWFWVRMEKRGPRIRVFIDGEQAFDYTDPQPLTGTRVAMWTRRNGIMVGRAAVYWTQERMGAPLPLWTDPAQWQPRDVVADPVGRGIGSLQTFESGRGDWKAGADDPGAQVSLDSTTAGPSGTDASSSKVSLRLTNVSPGGNLAARAIAAPFDAAKLSRLSFDYAIPPEATVNWHVRVGDKWYTIAFNGDPKQPGPYPVIGRIANVIADGKWHHAEIDLAVCLRKAEVKVALIVSDLVLADWSAPANLRFYGMTRIPAGTVMHIDNFGLLPAAGS